MVSYQELIEGMEVEITDGMYRGQKGVIAYKGNIDPVREIEGVMVFLGERNRESKQPIVHPFGYGVNKIEYLKVVNR